MEEEFNVWYDQEHVPERLAGFRIMRLNQTGIVASASEAIQKSGAKAVLERERQANGGVGLTLFDPHRVSETERASAGSSVILTRQAKASH